MVVETKEEVSEETKVEEPETEDTSEPVEKEGTKAKVEVKSEVKPITFQTQEELDKAIEKKAKTLADSISDKGLKTYQTQITDLKKQLKEATYKKEDDVLAKLQEAQTDEWGKTESVGVFQDEVKKLIADRRALNTEKEEWEENHQKATQSVKEVTAFTEALTLLLPDDDAGFITELTTLAEKIAGAETEKEKALLIELERAKLQALAEAQNNKPKRTKPDTGLPSASGGRDLSKLTPSEILVEGFKKVTSK